MLATKGHCLKGRQFHYNAIIQVKKCLCVQVNLTYFPNLWWQTERRTGVLPISAFRRLEVNVVAPKSYHNSRHVWECT